MARMVYKPLGMVVSVLGGILAGVAFKQIWKLVAHEEDPPAATDQARGWREVVTAAALQGAVFGLVKAGVDRAGASGFARLTGAWPGRTAEGEPQAA